MWQRALHEVTSRAESLRTSSPLPSWLDCYRMIESPLAHLTSLGTGLGTTCGLEYTEEMRIPWPVEHDRLHRIDLLFFDVAESASINLAGDNADDQLPMYDACRDELLRQIATHRLEILRMLWRLSLI